MSSVLFTIDSYLSTKDRADVCKNLISQIRKVYPEKKILLINKFPQSWGLDQEVDHYYFLGESFMVGYPPQEMLDSKLYERPYTYVKTSSGDFENWFPLVNVTDHVANIFNSFLLSARLAESLGYEKVFKIEYDTVFDEDEFRSLAKDIDSFQDFLFFGTRKEGIWAKEHHYLIDVHFIGYSPRCFDTYTFLKKDQDFWDLCKRVGYYGKWIEYIIPMTIEERHKEVGLLGKHFPGKTAHRFPKTKLDVINGGGEWAESMRKIPKVCRTGRPSGDSQEEITLFYWNNYENDGEASVTCKIYKQSTRELLYEKSHVLFPLNNWFFDTFKIGTDVIIESEATFSKSGKTYHQNMILSPHMVKDLDPRFLFK